MKKPSFFPFARMACLFGACWLGGMAGLSAQALIFSDNFNSAVAGSTPTTPWNEVIGASGTTNKIVADTSDLFGNGASNQIAQIIDNSATNSTLLGVDGLSGGSVVTLSFDFYEPSGVSGTSWNILIGDGTTNSNANSAFNVSLNDGTISSSATTYAQDAVHHIDIVANTSAGTSTYAGYNGSNTVASLKADVWIDGVLATNELTLFTGSSFTAGTSMSAIRFTTYSTALSQEAYLDNVALYSGAYIAAVPEPEAIGLTAMALIPLVLFPALFRHRARA